TISVFGVALNEGQYTVQQALLYIRGDRESEGHPGEVVKLAPVSKCCHEMGLGVQVYVTEGLF
ncbi:hypothetical protein BpHYR1_015538, partial [Brachionus plicatilis]